MTTATTTTSAPAPLARRLFGTVSALRAWAVASLAVNMLLVVTGAVVRLTSSGLGCPTWPQCSGSDYVPQPELGVHGVIEFGNRLLTFVLVALAVGTVITAFRVRTTAAGAPMRPIRILAVVVALGIPLQGVIGGITVLTHLNPWVVALHMVLSVAIIGLCVVMVHRTYDTGALTVSRLVRRLTLAVVALTGLVILLGTVVTGAGPHAGDGAVERNGIDPELAAHVHATAVWALLGLTIVLLAMTKSRLVAALLAVQLLQGVIGYVQYFTGLPVLGVALHMAGVAVLTAVTTHVLWSLREVASVRNAG
ncbi:MAG TPA: COX15/CtaA family protein [Propionibacteriaceae bacterium]|nr:COX15/CtaA family protein [Propionibacteriaceae bacterium]